MDNIEWACLKRATSYSHRLEIGAERTTGIGPKVNLTQLAFDDSEERLIAADLKGSIYYVELQPSARYYKVGTLGVCTFVAFNPSNKNECLIGLNTGPVQILRLNQTVDRLCSLLGHKFPVKHASFYKHYCLTSSCKEAIIWDLKSCCKAHQLKLSLRGIDLRKSSFSSMGLIVVLYKSDTMQAWSFKQLGSAARIDGGTFGLRNIKDFDFTKDGRAVILGGFQNKILILSTFTWEAIKRIDLPGNFSGIRQLAVVPKPLDGGSNQVLAILSSNCTLHFLDLNLSCFVATCQPIKGLFKIAVSPKGRYISYIETAGCLVLTNLEQILSSEPQRKEKTRATGLCRPQAHSAEQHLSCIRRDIKRELNLQRLLPILKEFGEYPKKHRMLIWASLLELPGNRTMYAVLASRSLQKNAIEELLKDYTLADRSRASLLAVTINCLVHWCPLLSQSKFLPRFVFPFLVVFQGNHMFAFEGILSVLSNYCQRWFEYHPLPPLNVLATIENVLSEADPVLLKFFCEKGVTSSEYVWPLLQTTLSEVLSGDDWLILWDHLFSSGRPTLLFMCALAYSICNRDTIISQLQSHKDFEWFYHTQGQVRAVELLKVAHRLDRTTPSQLQPSRYFSDKMCSLPSSGPYPPFLLQQYPKFLTEESQLGRIERLKEQEILLHKRQLQKSKLVESKRLQSERENFLKGIHETRVNELRSCYEAKVRNDELRLEIAQNEAEREKNIQSACICNVLPKTIGVRINNKQVGSATADLDWRSKNCRNLQNEVQKLEFEVQTLLGSLEPSTVRTNTQCNSFA